jgi:hypothetical protein
MIVDSVSHIPEAVVIAFLNKGYTSFNRLSSKDLQPCLEKFSLGTLWSAGEIGGNIF